MRDFHRLSWSCHVWHFESGAQKANTHAEARARRQARLPLVILCRQEQWLPGVMLSPGKMERGLVGSVKQRTCPWSSYFPIHKRSSVQPREYRRWVRGEPCFWPCWRASAVWAAGGCGTLRAGGCSAGAVVGGCWQVALHGWHGTPSPRSLSGGWALPNCLRASKRLEWSRRRLQAAQLPQVLFLFPALGEQCWGSAERRERGQLAFVHFDFS